MKKQGLASSGIRLDHSYSARRHLFYLNSFEWLFRIFGIVCCSWILLASSNSQAQAPDYAGPMPQQLPGQVVATNFSGRGTTAPDPNKFVIGIYNTHPPFPYALPTTSPTNWPAPVYRGPNFSWKASNLGQVFGIAIDKRNNIYTTATRCYYTKCTFPSVNFGYDPANAYQFGPAGPGGIYKLGYPTGAISNFVTSVPQTTLPAAILGTSKLPNGNGTNDGPALGNICYDPKHDQLFVTNMEDGRIYGIDAITGNVVSIYDPGAVGTVSLLGNGPIAPPSGLSNPTMGGDGGTPGYAPLGELLWGIGYNRIVNRLYYSVWVLDYGTRSSSMANIIRSVQLNVITGAPIPSTDQFEVRLPSFGTATDYSMPVSDIQFSSDGLKMLLAERGASSSGSDPGDPHCALPHKARVLEFSGTFSSGVITWNPGPKEIYIGQGTGVATYENSSGGADYDYRGYDTIRHITSACDSVIWASGDYLLNDLTFGGTVYGIQRSPESGNSNVPVAPNFYSKVGYFIDMNNLPGTMDKTKIGDVAVFRDTCGGGPIIGPCNSKSFLLTANSNAQGQCCWDLSITNQVASFWTSLSIQLITPGVALTSISTTASGWSVSANTWVPPLVGGFVPVGTTTPLSFCTYSLVNPPQKALLTWYGKDGSVCFDTLVMDCPRRPPPVPGCDSLSRSSIVCAQTGNGSSVYTYSFYVKNTGSNGTAYNLAVNSATVGVSVTPSYISFGTGGLATNQTAGPFTVTLNGGSGGQTVCISTQLHGAVTTNGYLWCCIPDTVCFILPKCADCCESFRKVIQTTTLSQSQYGPNVTSLTFNATAAPKPIEKASISIIGAAIKTFGPQCGANNWTPVQGYITGPPSTWGGLPLVIPPQPFTTPPPGPYSEVTYGTIPNGVAMSATPLALQLQFPPPPNGLFGCYDSLRFCVRLTFTDTSCVTCDTDVCYQMLRNGTIIIWTGGGCCPKLSFDSAVPAFGKITMTDMSTGTLTVKVPSFRASGGPPENEITVVGVKLEGSVGVALTSMAGTSAVDRVAQVATSIGAGSQKTFSVTYDNYASLTEFSNELTVRCVLAGDPRDTFDVTEAVLARTPNALGGDTLRREISDTSIGGVRTYALHLLNANIAKHTIRFVRLSTGPLNPMLAVGPPETAFSVLMSTFKGKDGNVHLFPIPEAGTDTTVAVIEIGANLKPVYLTLAGKSASTAVHYTTLDSNGEVLTQDSLVLTNPLSKVNGGGSGGTGALMPVYPNPASNSTTIEIDLNQTEEGVSLVVVDLTGREVARLIDTPLLAAGTHAFAFQTSGLPSGTYTVRLQSQKLKETRTFQIIR